MTNAIISTRLAPQAIGPYSQAVWAGDVLHLSGQIALDPATNAFQNASFETELKQIFANLHDVLRAASLNFNDIVKVTVYLTDFTDFATLNTMMAEEFKSPYPARTTIAVAALPKNARVEIDAIAYRFIRQ